MVTFSHTVLVNDPDSTARPIERDLLWTNLLEKAADPVYYVPSITRCAVIERFDDGSFVREIELRHRMTVREHVRPYQSDRIVFEQLNSPVLETITNEIGEDDEGRLTFTLTATLSDKGMEATQHEPGFLMMNDLLFFDTARATVNTLRLTAHALAPAG
ncbi:AtaL-like protein [Saccharomonospora saliphila]|uniref:AtaL-like protein n=1 Tax=Saccharomonospora saliphila TaxID=369829 RepID=UPI00037FE809|nr:AtaL-like protein [Saccharomonospora saliphila]